MSAFANEDDDEDDNQPYGFDQLFDDMPSPDQDQYKEKQELNKQAKQVRS